jgi:two-component system, NtrC family, response regulator PilR
VIDSVKHLLFVEDEALLRSAIAAQLSDRGYAVQEAGSGEEALDKLSEFAFDIIITDLRLPGIDGSALVEAAVGRYPDIVAIVVTGYGTVKDAVEAIKRGAWDFVSKPFQIEELLLALDAAMEQRRLKSENAYLRAQLDERHRFEGIVGKSRPMERLFHLLESVAPTNSTILISGETGSGKEVVARAIHHNSPRRMHRFVALNCSAIPETLLEAELFGHVRGAFTGAVGNRLGRFEQAHKGTLFLDEVGTMSAALQMKLLRALQEREFERIGDSHTTKVDVRVIAATNSDLARLVATGQFREDLYYRLNVIPVELPPLRERKEDIPLLVRHFLDSFRDDRGAPDHAAKGWHDDNARTSADRHTQLAGEISAAPAADRHAATPDDRSSPPPTDREANGLHAAKNPPERPGSVLTVSQEAMRRLMAFQWPGNVRQLENAIERAVALSAGRSQIEVTDLPAEIQEAREAVLATAVSLPEDGVDLDALIATIERDLILRSLDRTGGNKGRAAKLLNLKRTTLVEKLKRFDKHEKC